MAGEGAGARRNRGLGSASGWGVVLRRLLKLLDARDSAEMRNWLEFLSNWRGYALVTRTGTDEGSLEKTTILYTRSSDSRRLR